MTGALFSAGEAASILFGCFFVLLVLRVPVAFALGLACLPLFYLEPRLGTMMLAQETFNAYNSFILLAVPFFLLTANLMSVGGITDRLVALSRAIVGSFPGSLAQINVVLSVFFAGISGSSTADAASQSKISRPPGMWRVSLIGMFGTRSTNAANRICRSKPVPTSFQSTARLLLENSHAMPNSTARPNRPKPIRPRASIRIPTCL